MKLTSILAKEAITPQLASSEAQDVLRELAKSLVKSDPSLGYQEVYNILLERERLGSTGIGSGVAIPHGKLASAKKIIACFGKSQEGIDFKSQDGEPTHLFFALIAPENSAGLHLKVLAKLSRLLKDRAFREQLLCSSSVDEIFRILSREDDRD